MITILHAEDNMFDRQLFAELWSLFQPKSILRSVETALDAIEYLEGAGIYSNRDLFPFPDFLVIDLNMPNMDGTEFLQWRNSSEFRSLPTAVLTGSANEISIAQLTALGAVMVLSKGYSVDEFTESIKALLENLVPNVSQG